jgi:hypothetical protein
MSESLKYDDHPFNLQGTIKHGYDYESAVEKVVAAGLQNCTSHDIIRVFTGQTASLEVIIQIRKMDEVSSLELDGMKPID